MRVDVFGFEAKLDRTGVPAGVETPLKLHLTFESLPGVTAPTATATAMTTNICLVFDCSGSMAGKKRETAIEAAKLIVDTVHERHRLSLVGFSTKARVLVDNAQPTREGKAGIAEKIDEKIRKFPRGTTNLADGLHKAIDVLEKQRADAKVMIILSDGGADSQKKARNVGARATAAGIQLFAVGIGEDYEADALLELVTPSNGAVFGESDLLRIKSAFEVLIGRIESFVATQVYLSVTLGEKVTAGTAYKTNPERAVIGALEPDAKRQVKLHVGNVERGQAYGFLLAVTVPARAAGKLELARAALVYDAPSLGLSAQRVERAVAVDYVKGGSQLLDAGVHAAFREVQFVELAGGLADAQRRGDAAKSAGLLQQLIARAGEQGDEDKKVFYADVLEELNERGKISQDRLNALVLGSTATRKKKKGPQLYDVILLDPGAALIPLFRELRRITGQDLSAVNALVKRAPSTVQTLQLAEARALKKELEALGARAAVKPTRA